MPDPVRDRQGAPTRRTRGRDPTDPVLPRQPTPPGPPGYRAFCPHRTEPDRGRLRHANSECQRAKYPGRSPYLYSPYPPDPSDPLHSFLYRGDGSRGASFAAHEKSVRVHMLDLAAKFVVFMDSRGLALVDRSY